MSLEMTATKSTSSHASNSFDTLRLIFAVLVTFSHSFDLGRGSDKREPLYVLTHGQITFGNVSVWAFFVISGRVGPGWHRLRTGRARRSGRKNAKRGRFYRTQSLPILTCELLSNSCR